MAYDEDLADRIRELMGVGSDVTEKRMFGGLAFLVGGNMAVVASGQGGVMLRVDPSQSDKLVATSNARLAVMRGRPMRGWLRVDAEDVRTKRQLARWPFMLVPAIPARLAGRPQDEIQAGPEPVRHFPPRPSRLAIFQRLEGERRGRPRRSRV